MNTFMIIGAGGTGGTLGGTLIKAGHEVTLIARGAHLEAIRENGLRINRPFDPASSFTAVPAGAFSMDEYVRAYREGKAASPDVILVCVKGYSLDDVVPFVGEIAGKNTIVIPILNIFSTGATLQKQLPDVTVTDGCIYVAAQIAAPGVIDMNGAILRVFFGLRSPAPDDEEGRALVSRLDGIAHDMQTAGILGGHSRDIRKDALLKFSYVSAQGACGLYYGVPAGPIQQEGEIRNFFVKLVKEIDALAQAMGIHFDGDVAARNLKILDDLAPAAMTSLQRDIAAGKASEIDGLIYEVVRLGQEYNVPVPAYEAVAAKMRQQ